MPQPDKTLTKSEALREIGFWQGIDTAMVFAIAVNLLALGVSAALGSLSMAAAFVWLAVILLIVALWIVVLVFRTMWFVIQVTADIKMMPSAASQMVLTFLRGGK